MSLQHCLVLTVATGAVWMDLRTRRIANEWIITAWIAGLVTQLIRYGAAGAGIFLFGMLFPILALYILFYFHMLGAGDIKLLSAVGGFLGVPAILKYDEDTITDQPMRQIVAEIIREKALY
ncbi:MAG: prepilin peptidase, partial [Fusicatenibacter sp.]|nr:prepilin peptidase [Fusicatenibacter sp.]